MASALLSSYLGYGLASARPSTPVLFTGTAGYWYSTDTGILSIWTGSAWGDLVGGTRPGPKVNPQTGTTYTYVLGDANNIITGNNSAAITHTIPLHSSVAWDTGTQLLSFGIGAGLLTVSAVAGVTLNPGVGGVSTTAQYDCRGVVCIATDVWISI